MELHKPLPQSFTNMYILVRDMMKQTNIVLKFQTGEFYVALANTEDWCMVTLLPRNRAVINLSVNIVKKYKQDYRGIACTIIIDMYQ
jgi:hypothetical protein